MFLLTRDFLSKVFATRWIRKKMAVATKEIEAERAAAGLPGAVQDDVEMGSGTE